MRKQRRIKNHTSLGYLIDLFHKCVVFNIHRRALRVLSFPDKQAGNKKAAL